MFLTSSATTCAVLIFTICPVFVRSHALSAPRAMPDPGPIHVRPSESIVFPGDNVTFSCYSKLNGSFDWDFGSDVRSFRVQQGTGQGGFVSTLTLFEVSRRMSGEVTCVVAGDPDLKAYAFLIVNGVRNGGSCRASSDCMTDKAICNNHVCECPSKYVHLIVDRGFDVCRQMIRSLYDPCEYDEQCTNLVDSRSVCNQVCVCGPSSRDRRGKCVTLNEVSYTRNQEMYRVGLIAVTCIIILIVAVSLWVTLKRSCHENNMEQNRQNLSNQVSIDLSNDKPPSYDDVLVAQEVASPPDMKEALKNCMSAKKLLRQVSAPAGQLLSPQKMQIPKHRDLPPI